MFFLRHYGLFHASKRTQRWSINIASPLQDNWLSPCIHLTVQQFVEVRDQPNQRSTMHGTQGGKPTSLYISLCYRVCTTLYLSNFYTNNLSDNLGQTMFIIIHTSKFHAVLWVLSSKMIQITIGNGSYVSQHELHLASLRWQRWELLQNFIHGKLSWQQVRVY